MLDKEFADAFARDWIESWNAHDLERILAHYSDDFEMTSPMIAQVLRNGAGSLKGKSAVGAYWDQALRRVPDLNFSLIAISVGVDSLVIHYNAVFGRRAAEIFFFNPQRLVYKAAAHYE